MGKSNLSKNSSLKYISKMEVIKRNGRREKVSFDKIIVRIEGICERLELDRIDPIEIAKETIQGLYDGITTEELDFYAANRCAEKILDDYQYNKLAAGLCVSNLHKTTSSDFFEVTQCLFNNTDNFGNHSPLVTKDYFEIVKNNQDFFKKIIDYERDYIFDFFAIKTLERAYLIRIKNTKSNNNFNKNIKSDNEKMMRKKYGFIVERPQHLFMRVALGIHGANLDKVVETYNGISQQYFTHASPTLYNAGSCRPQMASCFLIGMKDSLKGIYKTISNIAKISKWSGGIGVYLSDIRASGSLIRGTNGNSDGIIPLIKVINETARYVNQGGRRNGAVAVYIEPSHPDVYSFCELRKNTGDEGLRARDIFLALWIPDLFMKRVKEGGIWSLMCPDECPGLTETFGEEYEKLYEKYEKEGRYKKQVKAEDLWFHILSSQIETGMPYMTFKDSINRKSNQKNIGVIKSSNLCSEIVQYSTDEEPSVCNLASICLPTFVISKLVDGKLQYSFNFDKLVEIAKIVTINLNKIIDINFYPVKGARISNFRDRPIGVGVQGLADTYCLMELPFDSEEARILNKKIFETIYFGCLTASNELAKVDGPYDTFKGSPFSQGILQYHMWGLTEKDLQMDWDWKSLIESIKEYGVRNSLLTTIMPTATTSQIMNNNECIEPYTTNLYTRTTLAGEYIVINRHLIKTLIDDGLWTKDIRNEFLYDNGSIQKIKEIPQKIKDIYKTAFEMKTKPIVQQAVDRGPFIDQSQSLNLFSNAPNFEMLTSSHFYTWANGLKTGMYYLRSQPAVDPIKFGLDPEVIKRIESKRFGVLSHKGFLEKEQIKIKNKDPKRINEIEENNEKNNINPDHRKDNYMECEFCSG